MPSYYTIKAAIKLHLQGIHRILWQPQPRNFLSVCTVNEYSHQNISLQVTWIRICLSNHSDVNLVINHLHMPPTCPDIDTHVKGIWTIQQNLFNCCCCVKAGFALLIYIYSSIFLLPECFCRGPLHNWRTILLKSTCILEVIWFVDAECCPL